MDREARLKDYLNNKINPIFEKLVIDLLIDTPENLIEYSLNWLKDKGVRLSRGEKVTRKPSSMKPKIEVQETPNYEFNELDFETHGHNSIQEIRGFYYFLKEQIIKLIQNLVQYSQQNSVIQPNKKPPSDDEEEKDEEDAYDEDEFDQHNKPAEKKKLRSNAVSAEVYGFHNKKGDFIPKVVPKSDHQKEKIQEKILQAFMFQQLDEGEQKIVIDAMEEKIYQPGQHVIRQGEDGDVLYLVDSGELECTRTITKDGEKKEIFLKNYGPGDTFGELALLYNAPRAATIVSKTVSTLFALDRECFNHIVKESSIKRRESYEITLNKVQILQEIDPYERTQLSDGLRQRRVKEGEVIIQEGEEGDNFYMVDSGEFEAYKSDGTVMEYKDGDYFGEIALIRNLPRQASVKSKADGNLVYLDKKTFLRLLGPIHNLFIKNESKYSNWQPPN